MSHSWQNLLRFIEIAMVVLLMLSEFAVANETTHSQMQMGIVNESSLQEQVISLHDSEIFQENIESLEKHKEIVNLAMGIKIPHNLNLQGDIQTQENILEYPDQKVIDNHETNNFDHIHRSLSGVTIRSLVFYEQYHYPVTLSTCNSYSISEMIDSKTGQFNSNSVFQERYLVYAAVTAALGNTNMNISFKCANRLTYQNTYGNQVSGQFGSDERTMYGSKYSYSSIPTIQVSNIYVYASVSPPTLNVLFSLGWFFFLGIFLAPIAAGFILLLLGRLSTTKIYGYQGLVFGMFRYINRQGDQQMFQWNHKILAFFLALFFFFHYALLLSNLTSSRITQIPSAHRDNYIDARLYQDTITKLNKYTQQIIVDSYQYQFLQKQYTVHQKLNQMHESLNDQVYNLQLSTSEFTESEIASINLAMSELRDSLAVSRVNSPRSDRFNVHNNDIFFNGLILIAALVLATLFKLLQIRFNGLNSLTEISSYREYCNQEITNNFSQLCTQQLTVSLSHVQASNYYAHVKKLKIHNSYRLAARQVFRIIQKRRKKSLKHKRKKIINQVNNTNSLIPSINPNILPNQQPQQDQPLPKTSTVYSVIKTFLQSERKGEKTALKNNPRNLERRKGIYQRAATSAFQNTEEEENQELPQLARPYVPQQNSLGMSVINVRLSSPTKASIFGKRRASQLKKNNTSIDLPFPVTKELVSMEQSASPFNQRKAQVVHLSQYSPSKDCCTIDIKPQKQIAKDDIKDTSLSILDTGRPMDSSQILSPNNILFTHPDFLQEPAKMLEDNNFKTIQNMTEGDEEIDSLMLGQHKQTSKFNPINKQPVKNNDKGALQVKTQQNQKNSNIQQVRTIPVSFKKIIIKEKDNFGLPSLSETQQENNGNNCIHIIKNTNHNSQPIENEIFLRDSINSSYPITDENSLHQIAEGGSHISNKISQKNQCAKEEESMSIGKESPQIYLPSLQAQAHHALPVLVSHLMPKNIIKAKEFKEICDPHTTPTPESSENHDISRQLTHKESTHAEVGQNIHITPARDKTKRYNAQYSSETPDSKQLTNLTDDDSHRKNSENTRAS